MLHRAIPHVPLNSSLNSPGFRSLHLSHASHSFFRDHTERSFFLKTLSLVVYFMVVYLSKASISLPYELLPISFNTSANKASSGF